jgi:DNA-binding HxlR family transcriptional regulator
MELHRIRGAWRSRVLVYLSQRDAGYFNRIGNDCGLPNPAATSRILNSLERDGSITRSIIKIGPPTLTRYEITDYGRAMVPLAEAVLAEIWDRITARFVRRRHRIVPSTRGASRA